MIPATTTQALESHLNEFIKEELLKLPGVIGHVVPGVAGLLVQAALGNDVIQAEALKLTTKGADFLIEESIKGLNDLEAATLKFLHGHPELEKLYNAVHPTLTGGQTLHIEPDEAKAIASMKLLGRGNEFRTSLGLPAL